MNVRLPARLLRYAVVGLLTLAIYLAIGELARRLGLAVIWQASLSFGSAVTINYLLQRRWVFGDRRPMAASLPKFAVMIAAGFVINALALLALAPRMPPLVAQLTAALLVVASNALFAFSWVFCTRIAARNSCPAKSGKRAQWKPRY